MSQTGAGITPAAGEGGLAWYNEIDPFAAAWLRELIKQGHIAPGVVDERDIRDVRPADLAGFVQCHFFAGIGVWSYALRQAGWPDDRPVWTGSCPCQPFSAAGGRAGFADERHLWPAFHWLIEQCRPELVAGEQVASGSANDWLDLVQADLEALDYAFGCVPLPAASVGSPNIRDRAFWMADSANVGHKRNGAAWGRRSGPAHYGAIGGMGHAELSEGAREREHGRALVSFQEAEGSGLPSLAACEVGDADDTRFSFGSRQTIGRGIVRHEGPTAVEAGPVNGFWRDAQWIWCSDGRWRPTESGVAALAHGAPARVGRLRGYGNAINAEVATAFIEAVIDILAEQPTAIAKAA